jgi:hypothetical protein
MTFHSFSGSFSAISPYDHSRLAVGNCAALDLGRHIVVAANVVAVVAARGFLHACAVLRGRMRHGGNVVWDGVLRGIGMGPGQGARMAYKTRVKFIVEKAKEIASSLNENLAGYQPDPF